MRVLHTIIPFSASTACIIAFRSCNLIDGGGSISYFQLLVLFANVGYAIMITIYGCHFFLYEICMRNSQVLSNQLCFLPAVLFRSGYVVEP